MSASVVSPEYNGDYKVDVRDFENARWQRGACLSYAQALKECDPNLQYGMHFGPNTDPDYPDAQWEPLHVFAHDGEFAYDSLGRHALPYERWDKTEYGVDEEIAISTDFREDGNTEEALEHIEVMHPQYRAQARMLQAGWRFMPKSGRWYVDDARKHVPQELMDYIGEPDDAPENPKIKAKYPWAFQ